MERKKVAAWALICVPLVAGFEGLRTYVYHDVGGIPTACYGETHGIKMGTTYTRAQCEEMLTTRILEDFGPAVDRCLLRQPPPARKAAYVSITYNIGAGAFCSSSMARLENAGDPVGACNALLLYNKIRVGGVPVYSRGLANRREEERKLCMTGRYAE